MKKLMTCGLLAAVLLAGCGNQQAVESSTPETTVHTHAPAAVYSWNGTEHWHECECGEKLDVATHNIDEDNLCQDCGVEVWDYGDGYADVTAYDEYGNMVRSVSYENGTIVSDYLQEHEYDEAGNIVLTRVYVDGDLQNQDEFVLLEDGSVVIKSSTLYMDDGKSYMEYDEEGNLVYSAFINAEGEKYQESWSEYAVGDDGEFYESKTTTVCEDGEKGVAEYNQYEDVTLIQRYDAEGNLTSESIWEYGYNEEGQWTWSNCYKDGRLVQEIPTYADSEFAGYQSHYAETVIDYFEDGSKLVTFTGAHTQVETETWYNADGSVASVTSYAYEFFDDGNYKRIQVYEDDVLVTDTEYVMDAEGFFSMKSLKTEYHADGTKTVYEYDEYEEVISEKTYDAEGNEI